MIGDQISAGSVAQGSTEGLTQVALLRLAARHEAVPGQKWQERTASSGRSSTMSGRSPLPKSPARSSSQAPGLAALPPAASFNPASATAAVTVFLLLTRYADACASALVSAKSLYERQTPSSGALHSHQGWPIQPIQPIVKTDDRRAIKQACSPVGKECTPHIALYQTWADAPFLYRGQVMSHLVRSRCS